MPETSKKPFLILTSFALMIEASNKDKKTLERVLYIHYLLDFRKDKKNKIQALINLSSKVNTIAPRYITKISLKVCHINIGAQKIDGSTIKMFEIVLANFQVENKQGRA